MHLVCGELKFIPSEVPHLTHPYIDRIPKNMSQEHERMVKALKEIVIPRLRERGFKGSFPHFRRPSKEKIDLLTFQFDKWGGGFVIEISKCPPDGIKTLFGKELPPNKHIPPNKVTAWHMEPAMRFRLQPGHSGSTADWFRYDKFLLFGDVFEKTAKEVLPFIEKAEKWWNG